MPGVQASIPEAEIATVQTRQASLASPAGAASLVARIDETNTAMGTGLESPNASALVVSASALATQVVSAIRPTAWSVPGDKAYAGQRTIITMTDAFGLQLGENQDSAKAVRVDVDCIDNSTLEITNLGPGDSTGAASAQFEVVFTYTGVYKICYRLNGGPYEMVGAAILAVYAAMPTSHNHNGEVKIGIPTTFTMTGGAGLQLGEMQDTVKVVSSLSSCLTGDPDGGTTSVTNLGPDDGVGATIATGQFTWSVPGLYKLCYKSLGLNYTKVTPSWRP